MTVSEEESGGEVPDAPFMPTMDVEAFPASSVVLETHNQLEVEF